ncbi:MULTISPECIES: hypothetical protein [Haloferax]|uniref:Uncharacterized protein n=1 Tax=Haloferax massiliensis TaxID=1476858 RepID=A0A0D6JXK2_9EURY|nr:MULTISPECIES: hypothetical protein [Haloferax]MDS0240741.1 hypothetical protein [Haloferax sp. S2CR25]MDS0443862.1 hypothetical protein [Haloferax sp. S2CR25-2]CQR53869.1 hypothetical protein BN996_03841 [Haloferax massiliensis]
MDRRFLAVVGVFDLLIAGGLAFLGALAHPLSFAQFALFVAAGVLLVVAGIRESVALGSTTLGWHVVAGAGYVCFGMAILVNGLSSVLDARGDVLFGGLSALLLAPVMLFMGIDYLRGGVHFDLSTFE